MGLSPKEYFRLTWGQYVMKSNGYSRRMSREWEHTRSIVYAIASANRDPHKPFPTLTAFMPLPTDSEGSGPTASRFERLKAKLEEHKREVASQAL